MNPLSKADRGILAARLLQTLHSQPGQHVSIGYEAHRMLLHPRIEPVKAVVQKEEEDSEEITILAVIIPREETITYLQNEYGLINGLRGSLERKP